MDPRLAATRSAEGRGGKRGARGGSSGYFKFSKVPQIEIRLGQSNSVRLACLSDPGQSSMREQAQARRC